MDMTVSNVKIVQCAIFHCNPWTTNWIRRVWNRAVTNFEARCIIYWVTENQTMYKCTNCECVMHVYLILYIHLYSSKKR